MIKKKRPILLLEVLIAFAIIALCIFPLIYPHAVIAKAQKEFIKKIELDHAVSLLYAQIYQDLHRNKIEWSDIMSQRKFEILPEDLKKINDNKNLPFMGEYHFEQVIHKPQTPQDTTAYLFHLIFDFYPQHEVRKNKEKNLSKKALQYKYTLFILRDLAHQKSAEPSPEEKK